MATLDDLRGAPRPRRPWTPKTWGAEVLARSVVALLAALGIWWAAATVVLVVVPVIWAGEKIGDLWRWWAHVWGILGY